MRRRDLNLHRRDFIGVKHLEFAQHLLVLLLGGVVCLVWVVVTALDAW